MFKASSGFFHFLFADQDDEYISSSYLMLDFHTYLLADVLMSGFKTVFMFGQDDLDKCWIECTGGISSERLRNLLTVDNEKKGLFSRLFSNADKKEKFRDLGEDGVYRKRGFISDTGNELEKFMSIAIDYMIERDNTAVILPLQLFTRVTSVQPLYGRLAAMRKKNQNNIVIILGDLSSGNNDSFFFSGELKCPHGSNQKCVFFESADLFPELKHMITGNTASYVKLYEVMKDTLRDRMQVWNNLSMEKLSISVRYRMMRSVSDNILSANVSPDLLAGVEYLWYNNPDFRAKYTGMIEFPENRLRRVKIAADHAVREMNMLNSAIIAPEDVYDSIELFSKWLTPAPSGHIIRDKGNNSTAELAIISLMRSFKTAVSAHEGIIDPERMAQIDKYISFFDEPGYRSNTLWQELPHELLDLSEMGYKLNLDTFIRGLSNKEEWNSWDEGIAHLLMLLFDTCWETADKPKNIDPMNQVGMAKFKKLAGTNGIDGLIGYFRKCSAADMPPEKAINTVNSLSDLFSSSTPGSGSATHIDSFRAE